MPSPHRWPEAVLAGYASSMRTFAAPGALAARGRIHGAPRAAVFALLAGELTMDKTSAATDRTEPPAVVGRVAAGALSGRAIASNVGIGAGAVGAAVGSYATFRARKLVVDRTGLPDPAIAVGEDLLAATVAAIATRHEPDEGEDDSETTERSRSLTGDLARGLAASAAGTAAMTVAQGAEFVLTDAKPSSSPADVARKISKALGLGRIKRRHRPAVNQGMHWLFGISWGVPFGLAAGRSNVRPEVAGPALGLLVWAAALGHQPAFGIAEVPWKRSLGSLSSEALFHLVYGIGAGAALRALDNG